LLFAATTLGVADTNDGFGLRQCTETKAFAIRKGTYRQLDFPYAVAAIAAMLLEYASLAGCQSQRQFLNHLIHSVYKCVGPLKARAVQELLPCFRMTSVRADKTPARHQSIESRTDLSSAFNELLYGNAVNPLVFSAFAELVVIYQAQNPPGGEPGTNLKSAISAVASSSPHGARQVPSPKYCSIEDFLSGIVISSPWRENND
jgi:hypothetical protein